MGPAAVVTGVYPETSNIREGGEIEEEVAMVDKACGAVTWVGA